MSPVIALVDVVRQHLGDTRQLNITRENLVDAINLYIYVFADGDVSSQYDKERGCLVVGGEELGDFLGFFYDFSSERPYLLG